MIPPGYHVTRDGRVKGPMGKWLKPATHRSGQLSVCFQVDGVQRRVMLGRVVCEEFHGPPPTPKHVAEHIDGDPSNNHADNLRWSTGNEVASKVHKGREKPTIQGETHPQAVLTWAEVRRIREEFAEGDVSLAHLARQYGVSKTSIHNIVNNKNWRDPGYTPPAPHA